MNIEIEKIEDIEIKQIDYVSGQIDCIAIPLEDIDEVIRRLQRIKGELI